MKRSYLERFKYHWTHLLFLFTLLLAQIVVANPDRAVHSSDGALTLESEANAQQPKSTAIRELRPRQVIEGELKSGEARRYSVALQAGEYMKVAVQSSSVGFALETIDPSGNAISKITVGGSAPTESLWMLAKTTGNYQIRISAVNAKGYFGRYIIRLEEVAELKTAPSSDQSYVKANQLYWEATALSDQGGDQPLHQAAEQFQEVLLLCRALGDRLGETTTLHMLGYVYARLGESPKAVELYEQSLSIWRTLKNHQQDKANTLYNLGGTYSFTGKVAEAIACYKEAIELRRLLDDKGGVAYALNNLGQVYTNVGELQAALDAYREALRLRIDIGDIEGQARSLSNISGVYFRLGEFQEALNYCKQALPLRRAAGDQKGEAITLSNIGSNYRELGEPQRALEYYQQSVSLLLGKGDRINEAALLDAIGQAYYDLGDYPKALKLTR